MRKTAFLFPGQGSQYAGMGAELAGLHASVRDTFAEADDVLGYNLSEICFNGPDDRLSQTEITQPAVLAAGIAFLSLVKDSIKPVVVAGHSLGEYTACVCSGAVSYREGLQLVQKRASYMQKAVRPEYGAMAAVIGLDSGILEEICDSCHDDGIVVCANYNSTSQTVISGAKNAVLAAMEKAKEKGARKTVLLSVSVPSHSPFMEEAAAKLLLAMNSADFIDGTIPVVNNVDALEVIKKEDLKDSLFRQLFSSVRWRESVKLMLKNGIDTYIEIGPKRVLSQLVKETAKEEGKEVTLLNIEDAKSFEKTMEFMQG